MEGHLNTFEEFMRFLANASLPSSTCYWGYNLNNVKAASSGALRRDTLCDCRELTDMITDYVNVNVANSKPVCYILSKQLNSPFNTNYLIVRYIADYLMPDAACYYGYNLDMIRSGDLDANAINSVKLDNSVTSMLANYKSSNLRRVAEGTLCDNYRICNVQWKRYLMCQVGFDTCNRSRADDTCVRQLSLNNNC